MTDDPPWEPPLAGTEVEHLVGALERLRTTFRWKADDLDADGLRARIGASALTLGGLLKHLAWAEDLMFTGMPACAAWSATSSRSTAATPGTPTFSAKRWTGGSGRTAPRVEGEVGPS